MRRREFIAALGGAFFRLDISANNREAMPVLKDSVVWPLASIAKSYGVSHQTIGRL